MAKAAQRSDGYHVDKGVMAIVGHPVGPPRPPTLPLNDAEMDELRAIFVGFGWPVPDIVGVASA
jgi:hypothetical protein